MTAAAGIVGTLYAWSAATPGTFNSAGFAALSWTPMTQMEQTDGWGDDISWVEFTDISTGRTVRDPGAVDGGVRGFSFKSDPADAGQTIVVNNAGSATSVSLRCTYPNGKIIYLWGKLAPLKDRPHSPNSYQGYDAQLAVNAAPVRT